jgi:transmembrane sensor
LKIDAHILALYLDNRLSEEEVRAVENALASSGELRAELDLLRQIDDCAVEFNEVSASTIKESWNEFALQLEKPPIKIQHNFNWIKYAAAAAVLIFGSVFFFNALFNGKVEQLAQKNELYTLPDGSELIMNSGSEISYNENTFLSNRTVFLKGDVLFRVKSNKKNPFFLITSNSKIEVTGTKFRVYADNNNTSVSLYKGALQLQSNKKTIYLKPGENATCVEGALSKTQSKMVDISTDWFSLDFESIPFSEIVKNLERRFDVEVKYPQNLKNQKYTIRAEGLKLEEIMTILTELTNTSVTINGRFIELKS